MTTNLTSAGELHWAVTALADFTSADEGFNGLRADRERHQKTIANLMNLGGDVSELLRSHHKIPDEHAAVLHQTIAGGKASCARASKALIDGGAIAWDQSTSPNAAGQRRSIELHARLQAVDRGIQMLGIMVSIPDMLGSEDIDSLWASRTYFKAARDELRAVAAMGTAIGPTGPTQARASKLPELKPHDRQAWQLSNMHGKTQSDVAAALNNQYGTIYTQGHIYRG